MEQSDSDDIWVTLNMHYVILHTVGRKSAKHHKVALFRSGATPTATGS